MGRPPERKSADTLNSIVCMHMHQVSIGSATTTIALLVTTNTALKRYALVHGDGGGFSTNTAAAASIAEPCAMVSSSFESRDHAFSTGPFWKVDRPSGAAFHSTAAVRAR